VLAILAAAPNGEATIKEIKRQLPMHIALSTEDRTDSETRLNEEIWEQQVRNLKSHDKTQGNIFNEGFVEVVARGVWRITNAGRHHIAPSTAA
jgi:hypothetical protein